MDSILNHSLDSGHEYSCEALHSGLYYTSAYYEAEQLYSENVEPTKKTTCSGNHRTPVEIQEHSATVIDLPPIEWHGYKTAPKILSVTNTGRTVLINGQWVKGRPYIGGGPLNGTYIFSQIHFHSPSEHKIGGKRYPLEMHVVHYKTNYLTQERAMRERDGTVVLVYLFQVSNANQTHLPFIKKLTPEIEEANYQTEITDFTLDEIVTPFSSNYYIYWGSLTTEKKSFFLQWIINGCVFHLNEKEADHLLNVVKAGGLKAEPPRMKPENDGIFYVEESEPEPFEETDHCNICHVYQDWCLNHSRGPSSFCQNPTRGVVCSKSSNWSSCTCQKAENYAPPLGPERCKKRKSLSGLRICCCQKKKKCMNSCCNKTPPSSVCSCTPASETSVSVEDKKSKTKKKSTLKAQETSSCPSVSTDVGSHISEEEACEIKVVCSCPSVNKCSSSHECDGKPKEKKKNKKKVDTCRLENCKLIESSSKQYTIVCTPKQNDTNSVCSNVEKDNTSKKKSGSEKKAKKNSLKKSKKLKKKKSKDNVHEPHCENGAMCSNSKSSTNVNRNKASKTNNHTQIEYVFSSLPEKSFKEILRECDTTWLVDSKFKMSKTDCKLSSESSLTTKSKESVRSKTPSIECKDTITTLYEKKRSTKPLLHVEDCTVNFLLTPDDRQSNPSSFVRTTKSISEEIKSVQNLELSRSTSPDIGTFKISGIKQPIERLNESAKELCVQVELLINSEKKDFSDCVNQEYNFALMYNQNILQEYRGVFHPDKILLGNYEKLELVPKYPEPDSLRISVQDCIIKMETFDKLCMRAKFLLKEISLESSPKVSVMKREGNSEKKIVKFSDAVTQCSVKKFITPNDIEVEVQTQNNLNQLMSKLMVREEVVKESKSSLNILNMTKEVIDSSIEEQSSEQIFLKSGLLEAQECKVALVQNPVNDLNDNNKELFNSSLTEEKKCEEGSSKSITKKTVKELKELFSSKKKTVYFMYEKIEKDENSGKNILIGSFRSKEEVQAHSKDKKANCEATDGAENNVESKRMLLYNKGSENPLEKVEQETKVRSSNETRSVLNDEKDVITLHKFKPRHLGNRKPRKERLNLVVGRALSQLERDSKSFRRLADLIGMTKRDHSKITVYELQKPPENDHKDASASAAGKENQMIEESKDLAHTSKTPSKKNGLSKTSRLSFGEGSHKGATKKTSQSAVIVIPVEVESLSKVEVILVEHSSNPVKITEKVGKEVFHCLNCSS